MPLAVDAGGGPVGDCDLDKPFAGSHAGLSGMFYFAQQAQPSQGLAEGTLAGAGVPEGTGTS